MNPRPLENLADRLIAHIRTRPGAYHDWKRLAARLRTDPDTLKKAVAVAASWDYRLRVRKTQGVAFIAPPDALIAPEILHRLATRRLGQVIHSFKSTRSTNDLAVHYAENGAPEGTVVTAEHQTKGRGRLGRSWHSPAHLGIYFSVILRPAFRPEEAPGLSLVAALALAETLVPRDAGHVQIKWPNDILINGRKVAGILTELAADRNKITHVIVGVGINVNQRAGDFPPDLRATATSLRRELKHKVDRLELLRAFLLNLERGYDRYLKFRLKYAHARLRRLSSLLGQTVTVASGRSHQTGIVKDIDAHGRLVLQTAAGLEYVTAGEVAVVTD